jgi:hypothetical protein
VCRVSAVPRGRSPGNCFPQLGPQLFVITGEAVTSRSRLFPILMVWWSAQCNDYSKICIAAGRARQHQQQRKGKHTERDRRSGSGGVSEYSGGFHPLSNGGACCGSKPARWRCRVFFTKEKGRYEIPEEPARRGRALIPPSASTGPLRNMDASSPHDKYTPTKYTKELAAYRRFANYKLPWPVRRAIQ